MNSELETNICNRIRLVREINNLSRPQFAEITKAGKTVEPKDIIYIRSVEHYRHTPSFDFLIKVRKHFRIRWEWLIEGTGKMQ